MSMPAPYRIALARINALLRVAALAPFVFAHRLAPLRPSGDPAEDTRAVETALRRILAAVARPE